MTEPKEYPLEAFNPQLEEILKRGARGESFTIRCKTTSQAHRLQHMLHSFRSRAKKYHGDTAPERWRPLYIAVIARINDELGRKTILHIYSRQDEFKELLDQVVGPLPEPEPNSSDPLAEFTPTNGKPEGSGG